MDVDVKHSRDLLLLYGILLFFISPLFPFQWCWPCSNWHYSCYNGCGHPPKMIQWCFLQLLSYGALLQHRGISWFLVNKKKEFFKKKLFCKLKKVVLGDIFFMNETREKFIIQLLRVKIRCDTCILFFEIVLIFFSILWFVFKI